MLRITLIIISPLIFLQLYFNQQLPASLSAYYLLLSVITLSIYAFDKSAARRGKWRIKESHLHILSLLGGWWGALIGQQFLRHKSVKKNFLIVFGITLTLNISALTFFFISRG